MADSIRGYFWTPTGWSLGTCTHSNTVQELKIESELAANVTIEHDANEPIIIPAPVDLHIHGGGGYDCMQGADAIVGVLRSATQTGTAALLATSVTAPFEQISSFLNDVARVMQDPPDDAAHLMGAHLEGPFINSEKLGAQPPFAVEPDLPQLQRWLQTGVVKVVTLAPELDPEAQAIKLCQEYGARVQLGHTLCSWQQAQYALKLGCGVTHLFNAMSGVSSRNGGAALGSLSYAEFAEIITDGIHVDQAAFDLAMRSIPQLYSVTDATAATGMPDGQYELGSLHVHKVGHSVRLAEGTLAGSCLTQLRSIEVLREWGVAWHTVAELCSARPARWIGARHHGQIEVGCHVDWLEIHNNKVCARWLRGVRFPLIAKTN